MNPLERLVRVLPDRVLRPMEVGPGVHQLRTLGARVTVVAGRTGLLLVDAGGRGSLRLIQAGLRGLSATTADIDFLTLTHYHPDHGGGLGSLAAACESTLAVHRIEAEYVRGEARPLNPFRGGVMHKLVAPFVPVLYSGPANVDLVLEDGDSLPWCEEVRVIHTPGHTPGSICLYLPERKLLIAGDAMQYRLHHLSEPASAVTLDPVQARASLKKLMHLDIETVCFGHFSPLRGDIDDQLRQLFASSGDGLKSTATIRP